MFRIRLASLTLASRLALGGLVLLVPSGAFAQTLAADTARATELFKNGKAAFAKGDLPEAERLFGQALALRKSSDIAANLAQAELEQQKFRSAAAHFSWALANLLPSASDAQRKAVEQGLAKARGEVGVLRLEIKPDGADVLVADQALGRSPIDGVVFVDPGEVIVSVKHEGYVALDKRVLVTKGTEQPVQIELPAKEPPATAGAAAVVAAGDGTKNEPTGETADRAEHKSLVPAFIATGVAVAGGGVGLAFMLSASSKEQEADDLAKGLGSSACVDGGDTVEVAAQCQELKSKRDSVTTSRNVAIGAFVVGGVAALVAGYFYWDALSPRDAKSARQKSPLRALRPSFDIAGSPGRGSFELGLSGDF
ncbi:MAG TPA: PEGA domain-containing protein [Polyangiaceae bacterium]